jgi:hypothetical protein
MLKLAETFRDHNKGAGYSKRLLYLRLTKSLRVLETAGSVRLAVEMLELQKMTRAATLLI